MQFCCSFLNGSAYLNVNIVFFFIRFPERSYLTARAKMFLSGLETAKLAVKSEKVLQSLRDYRSKFFNNSQEQ